MSAELKLLKPEYITLGSVLDNNKFNAIIDNRLTIEELENKVLKIVVHLEC